MALNFTQALQARGWAYVPTPDHSVMSVPRRYPEPPSDLASFIGSFKRLCSADETQWLLSAHDYAADHDGGFAWNEYERLSLKGAAEDPTWEKEIEAFWSVHLPVFISVRGYYSYAAYCFAGAHKGRYVRGCEPEFEQVSVVAVDFNEFQLWVLHEVST